MEEIKLVHFGGQYSTKINPTKFRIQFGGPSLKQEFFEQKTYYKQEMMQQVDIMITLVVKVLHASESPSSHYIFFENIIGNYLFTKMSAEF